MAWAPAAPEVKRVEAVVPTASPPNLVVGTTTDDRYCEGKLKFQNELSRNNAVGVAHETREWHEMKIFRRNPIASDFVSFVPFVGHSEKFRLKGAA